VTDQTRRHDVFEILGHETRFAILEALGEAGPLSFTALHDRVPGKDSGRFNYHLGRTVGSFVEERDDGYALTAAGRRVYGAVLAGRFDKHHEEGTVETDAGCTDCGGPLEVRFEPDRVGVVCSTCDAVMTRPTVPPGVFAEWPREAAAEVIARWTTARALTESVGLCPSCSGRVDRRAVLPDEELAPEWFDGETWGAVVVVADCRRCGQSTHAVPEVAVLHHPRVASFHYDRGVDVRTTPFWAIEWLDWGTSDLVSVDPLRIAVPVSLDDVRRIFVFGRDLTLVGEYGA